jgi:outer membrane assembly lipoprotein YfiO
MKKLIALFIFSLSPLLAQEEDELAMNDFGPSVQEFNSYLQGALQTQDWWSVIGWADAISDRYPTTPFAQETPYLIGEAYFNLHKLEYANDYFTTYLNTLTSPKHFEEAIQYKFEIAEAFANGAKKHLFGSPKMPAWISAEEDAIPIFDEVIAALPHSELCTKSLLSKARIQAKMEDFKPSIETLDLLIRRFPKHELAAEAYLEKTKVYLTQCKLESLDPALLDLTEVNLRKFRLVFPREPRLAEAEKIHFEMKELFAENLLEVGRFYEKTKKIPASAIYYNRVIGKYPNTQAAEVALEKLESLKAAGKI